MTTNGAARTSILVTGPARSGKSEWAERLALASGWAVTYIATAREDPDDPEWTARIELHRHRRPPTWLTVCAPLDLESAIQNHDQAGRCLLVDSLGTWVTNLLETDDAEWDVRVKQLVRCLARARACVILVAEETGWGVIPAYPLGRQFRDRLGALIRQLGPRCAETYLVTGGYAVELGRIGVPID